MTKKKILVVDDERDLVNQLKMMLEGEGYEVTTAENGVRALNICTGKEDVIITDMIMPQMDGLKLLNEVKKKYPKIPVIMITGQATIKSAVKAMKDGATDYVTKPYEPEEIFAKIEKEIRLQRICEEVEKLKKQREKEFKLDDIIGKSKSINRIKDLMQRVAPTTSSVLIEGPSGTGKELIAKGVHYLSKRKYENFVIVNCAAIPETLLEAELFGYKKGSFTDAKRDKKGFFEEANGGTIFLDEIGDMSKALQAKVLRVIQDGEFVKIGETKRSSVDVRLITATNKKLREEIEKGNFREDLYFRINVINIKVPPLTERREDIPELIKHFIVKYDYQTGKKITGISDMAMEMLKQYMWPGNIRELENIIERAVILSYGEIIEENVIEASIEGIEDEVGFKNSEEGISYRNKVRKFERELIRKALEESKGRLTKAAEILRITRHSLRYQMEKLGMNMEEEKG